MAFFYILLFVLLYYLVIRPLWRGWRLYRKWNDATGNIRSAFEDAMRQQRQQQQPEPPAKKKKIDPTVGEYVAYEEISCNVEAQTAADTDGSRKIKVEEQVEDAVWEEIR